jgi:hypothetical protein
MPDPLTYAARQALRAATSDRRRGLGDVIEAAVKPIARILQLPCLDAGGRLKPDSGCAKRRDALNKAARLRHD